MTQIPTIQLNDGSKIPQLGFGTWQISQEDAGEAVMKALEVGYRAIDTAAVYDNEAEVGGAINGSGIDRSELFVTTKLWNSDQGRDRTKAACSESLSKLGLDYLDLYLMHWPVPTKGLFVESWQMMEELRDEGLVRSIGVSNFREEDLERLAQETETVPALNQIELHPSLQQRGLREVHSERGIVTQAWSPLGQGELFDDPVLTGVAESHSKSAAQVMLRWQMELGHVTIPKSVTAERIQENFEIWDFQLSEADMSAISELDAGRRTGPDPSTFKLGL